MRASTLWTVKNTQKKDRLETDYWRKNQPSVDALVQQSPLAGAVIPEPGAEEGEGLEAGS